MANLQIKMNDPYEFNIAFKIISHTEFQTIAKNSLVFAYAYFPRAF